MEKNTQTALTPEYLFSLIERNAGKIESLERRTAKHGRTIKDMEEEYPLLPPEAEDLANEVKRRGAWVMGGKKSNAYHDRNLRSRVYRDIYGEMKRQYGLVDDMGRQKSYKKLKRKYLKGAIAVVEEYELPIALQNEVDDLNDLEGME